MLNQTKVDRVFHALGDPTRRALMTRLSNSPASATDLVKPLKLTLAAVVQHLQVLERSGLIRTAKTGRVRICSLDPEGLRVADTWIRDRRVVWEKRLDRLGRFLATDDDPSPTGRTPS